MSTDFNDIHYPNLTSCRVTLMSTAASSKPIVQLPASFHDVLRKDIKRPYDFSYEHAILKRKEDLDEEMKLATADSREELQKGVVVKMKSVTGCSDDLCISFLEDNGYDLKTSIEAFYLAK
mmetsp:Transcript_5264/g.14223  ORF Transcript_5264/g.14223 Transcript_5264/m.14223 type:complete len:121 (-) Transcript_5264:630-992(-)